MDKVIQKSHYQFLENFIKSHMNRLLTERVYIFGAGVRGCNLLTLLRQFKIPDIKFVDNNPKKQGKKIEECPVISFEEADKYKGKKVFLCQIEYGSEIIEQLKKNGKIENVDYFNLDFDFTDYRDVIEELKSPVEKYAVLLGNCVFSSYILGEGVTKSLGENLKDKFYKGKCKLISLPGLSSPIYYFSLLALKKTQSKVPNLIFLSMEMSCISPYAPMLLGKQVYMQHVNFVEQLQTILEPDSEVETHLHLLNHRLQQSLKGKKILKADSLEENRRTVYELKYQYEIDDQNENIVYTKKILEFASENNIPVILFFPPVDYLLAENICGKQFLSRYRTNIRNMQSMLQSYEFEYIDASTLVKSDGFVQQITSPDINPWLNKKGQDIVMEFLDRNLSI